MYAIQQNSFILYFNCESCIQKDVPSTVVIASKKRKYDTLKKHCCDYCNLWFEDEHLQKFSSFSYYTKQNHLTHCRYACKKTCLVRCYGCHTNHVSLRWKKYIGLCWSCCKIKYSNLDTIVFGNVECSVADCNVGYNRIDTQVAKIASQTSDCKAGSQIYCSRVYFVQTNNSIVCLCSKHVTLCVYCLSYTCMKVCYDCQLIQDKWNQAKQSLSHCEKINDKIHCLGIILEQKPDWIDRSVEETKSIRGELELCIQKRFLLWQQAVVKILSENKEQITVVIMSKLLKLRNIQLNLQKQSAIVSEIDVFVCQTSLYKKFLNSQIFGQVCG